MMPAMGTINAYFACIEPERDWGEANLVKLCEIGYRK
jgi:hypothetical protein